MEEDEDPEMAVRSRQIAADKAPITVVCVCVLALLAAVLAALASCRQTG